MNVTVLVCDEIRIELSGKLFIIGMYTGNIAIPHDDFVIPSINFLFSFDCALSDMPKKVAFEITMPGGVTNSSQLDVAPPEIKEHHTRWYMRHALGFQNTSLRSGKIEAKIVVDDREIIAGAPWIVIAPPQESIPVDPTNA